MDWHRINVQIRLLAMAMAMAMAMWPTAEAASRISTLGDNVQLSCTQPAPASIACDFRLIKPSGITAIAGRIGDIALTPPDVSVGAGTFNEFLIYFLVDVSNPLSQPTTNAIRRHIQSLVRGAAPYHRFGLAAFSSETQELAKSGSSGESVINASAKIKPAGHTTELYRSTLQAVRLLSSSSADRKALFVFSDGLAEDQAYFHEDVVSAANAGGIIIVGLGYARSVQNSVALQSIRRLAEDTGGAYIAAGEHPELPTSFVEDVYQSLGNGGGFTFDLTPVIDQGLPGTRSMLVQFTLDNGAASATLPVQIPAASSLPTPTETASVTATQTPATTSPSAGPGNANNMILWVAVGLLAALVLVMFCVMLVLLRRNASAQTKPTPDKPAPLVEEPDPEAPPSVAYLEPVEDADVTYAITSATYRIGRHSSNDLPVPDPSVSRQHAEIRRRGSSFTITDLDSMNGVFVNNKQRKHSPLSDNDSVELGDVAFRFKLETTRELAGESTVMLKESPSEFDFDITLDDDEDEEKIA